MNWYIISAGLISTFTTLGHFAVGGKEYLNPMLSAEFEAVPKKVMHAVFHYVSVYLILSSLALLATGFGLLPGAQAQLLIRFIALNYAAFAIWQMIIALGSNINQPLIKMFQWVFFVVIAVTAWLSA